MKMFVPGLATVLLLAGCGSQLPSYPVAPPLPAETIPLPPVSEEQLIWHPGDWVYVDGSYRYEAGRYEPRGDHGALWTRGHWAGTAGNYIWVPGSWS
jgi:hypothetical protein